MSLPGFDGLRVPSRFWMMGVLCLAAAAGIGYASLAPRKQRIAQIAVGVIACAGLLGDGWLKAMPTRLVPPLWSAVRGADPRLALLELPIGPGWDSIATLRTSSHHRRVLNGVSGYEPRHYPPMQEGLLQRDPEMLKAIASLGAFEVSIERASDSDGRWRQYVLGAPGAVLVAEDAERAIVRVPAAAWEPLRVGAPLQISSARASVGDPAPLIDGRLNTDWGTRQQGSEWLLADLGSVRTVGGVSLAIQKHSAGFPRHLAIDISNDGERFEQVWEGNGVSSTFLAVLRAPITGWLRVGFSPREARYVRLRQTVEARGIWVVPELEVNGPPPGGRP
jgi:F5/8 type C domain